MIACWNSNERIAKILIDTFPNMIDEIINDQSALFIACQKATCSDLPNNKSAINIVKMLMDKCDINWKKSLDEIALMCLCCIIIFRKIQNLTELTHQQHLR